MSNKPNNSTIILNGVRLFWIKCDPAKPVAPLDEGKPDRWEAQLRIDLDDKVNVETVQGAKIPFKTITEVADGEKPYMRLSVHKPVVNREGKALKPVDVINGALQAIDPNTIGNGSVGNVRLHVYPYELRHKTTNKVTKSGITSMLMGIQVTTLKVYRSTRNDFKAADYTVVDPSTSGDGVPGIGDDAPDVGGGVDTDEKF